jgi:4-amino-4-deoxy-L-arabinose transferase-like glycosyltransferase
VPGSFWARLLIVALLGLVVRVGYVALVVGNDPMTGDAFYYHNAANLLADGKGFIDPARYVLGGQQEIIFFGAENVTPSAATELPVGHEEPTAGHPPVWTVVLAAFSKLGLRTELEHRYLSAVFGALGVAAIGLLGRELAGDRAGLVAAGLASVHGFLWLNDGMVMSETLLAIVVPAVTIAALRFAATPTLRRAAAFGALGAVAALTRAELVLYVPIVAFVLVVRARLSWRDRAVRLGGAALAMVVVLSPWVVRNLTAFAEPVLLSNGSGTVLVQANCDATYSGEKLGYWELLCGLPQPLGPDGEPLDESQRDVVLRRRGLDYIADHTTRLVTVVVPARVGRMWAVYDPIQQLRFDILVEGRNFRLSMLSLAQYWLLVPAAVAGAIVLRRRRVTLVPLVVWPALVTLTAVTAFGTTRYRVTAEIIVVALAAVALDAVVDEVRRRRGVPRAAS